MNYADLAAPSGQADNMGGLTTLAYYAPIEDFLSIKKITASPTTPADLVNISAAHTFKTGKCFKKMYCTMNRGSVESKSQGDIDGKSFKQSGKLFLPGSLSAAHGFAAMCKNDNFILLLEMPDSATVGHLQVGTEMFPAKISPNFTTAQNESGVRGYEFEFEAVTDRNYIYPAGTSISLTPAI